MRHTLTASAIICAALSPLPLSAADIDWSAVPKGEIILFYPGQSSWEWIVNAEHKAGATGVRDGKNCLECHAEEEADIGDVIVRGDKLEPAPIPGKPGTLKLTVQAAYDQENLYLRASWPSKEAGRYHEYRVYKDGKWEKYGSHRTAAPVAAGEQPPVYEDRFTVMLGDGRAVPEFATAGCWVTCHNDLRFMPDHPGTEEVEAHPVLGKEGLKKHDVRKYLLNSRTEETLAGSWRQTKSKDEIAALRQKGAFLDLWQWRAHRSNPVNAADDGYVAEYRLFDAGKKMFADNWDKSTNQPKFMFDPAKNGGKPGLALADIKNPNSSYYLADDNKVAYDPNAGWKNGDVLLNRVLTAKMEGSAGDNNKVFGEWADGRWSLTWTRKLDTGNQADDVALKAGQVYPIGLAVHSDYVTGRFHHVSFPLRLSLGGGDGEINAVALR